MMAALLVSIGTSGSRGSPTGNPTRPSAYFSGIGLVVTGTVAAGRVAVGERLLPTYNTIKERIEQRAARRSPAEKLFIRITGLALKMEQYRLGESFFNAVVARRGVSLANRVWEGPNMMPTLEELRNPKSWMERINQ